MRHAVNGVGQPYEGELHARLDGEGLETEQHHATAPALHPTGSQRLERASRSAQPGAKAALAEIWNAEDREHAEAAGRSFVAEYGTVRLRQRVTKGPDRGRPAWRWRPPVLTIAQVLVKVLQRSVDDEKSFGVTSNPSLPVRRMGEPGLNRSMGLIPGRREGAQR